MNEAANTHEDAVQHLEAAEGYEAGVVVIYNEGEPLDDGHEKQTMPRNKKMTLETAEMMRGQTKK